MNNIKMSISAVMAALIMSGCVGGEPLPPKYQVEYDQISSNKWSSKSYNKKFKMKLYDSDFITRKTYAKILRNIVYNANKSTKSLADEKERKVYSSKNTIFFTQSAYPKAKYGYGLRKKIMYKIHPDEHIIDIEKINSKLKFSMLTAGISKLDNNTDKIKLLEISKNYDKKVMEYLSAKSKKTIDTFDYAENKEIKVTVKGFSKDLFIDTYKRLFKVTPFVPSRANAYINKYKMSYTWENYNQDTSAVSYNDNLIIITGIKKLFATKEGVEAVFNTLVVGNMNKDNNISTKLISEELANIFKNENFNTSKLKLERISEVFLNSYKDGSKYPKLASIDFKH